MVEIGNIYYFSTIIFTVVLIISIYLFLKNKSKIYQFRFLLIWAFLGFLLHFLKQFVYMDINKLSSSTAENICAVSTLFFPFIMLIKKKSAWHDFMFLIGMLGGLAALVYPTEAMNRDLFSFEPMRFYFCHISILSIPLLLALLNIRKPDIKNWWIMPLCFLGYLTIIFLNSALVSFTGMEKVEGFSAYELFLDRNLLNNSFVFGPTDDMGGVGKFIGNLTLPFMRYDLFNLVEGDLFYWPVIWLLIPSYILFVPLYMVFSLPFNLKFKKIIES